jgi:CDP-6-deoxy-D-xylo-4-hexulose-3-dehydrase
MIPLMKKAFLNEYETKKALCEFIMQAERLSMDEKCFEFEKKFSIKQNREDSILFNSGGSANLAVLQALKNLGRLKDGDKIGFSALTWSTNTMPIIQMGFIPVAIDCEVETMNISSYQLIKALNKNSLKALFLTNVLGFVSDIWKLKELCIHNNIILIEDNCESLGTETQFGKAGNFSLVSTFSFFVAHHMSTIEGGMACTDDEELAQMLRIVRANGWDRNLNALQQMTLRKKFNINSEFQAKYTFYDLGYNLRPTEITGFLGLYQLQFLDDNINKRESNYLLIEKQMQQNEDLLILKRDHISKLSTFAIPVICKNNELRNKYLSQFSGAGIEIRPLIAGNMQIQPFYSKYVKEIEHLPNVDFLHNCSFYCGNYPELTTGDLEIIKSSLTQF